VVELDELAGRQMSRRDHRAMRACARVAREVKEGLQGLRQGAGAEGSNGREASVQWSPEASPGAPPGDGGRVTLPGGERPR
jgi:hypothetical protein